MKIPYFCCIGAELKRYAQDFDFMNQVYLYKVPTDDSIDEVLAEDYFKAISNSVLQDDIVYIYEASAEILHECRFDKQNGHITAIPLASDETLTGAVTSIIHDNLTPNKLLKSDANGKVAASDFSENDFVKVDGSSIMTGPLKFRAGSFEGAIAGGLGYGISVYKLKADGSIDSEVASLTKTNGFVPGTNNAMDIGKNNLKWKDAHIARVITSVINNGYDIAVPVTNSADTLALKSEVDLAANSGRMILDQGVWYAKMYAATVAPSAENGTNYADFSQTDGQGNPIIVTYNRVNGVWVQDQTITPPAEYDGYVPITSKIWDITEQAGQQGGRILWNHQSKEFTPYPQIISFEDIEVTGNSTVVMPQNPSTNQIVDKHYVDEAIAEIPTGGSGLNVGDIFYTMRNDNELNGAVECNGAIYVTTDFIGAQSIGNLLAAGKIPYVSMADYATALATNGSVGVFGWDGGTGTTAFRVPKLNDIFVETGTAAQIGDFVPAGAPNIIGKFTVANSSQKGNIVSTDGCVYADGTTSGAYSSFAGDGNSASGPKVAHIDASRSSSAYGNSDTIQPKSVRYRAMVQLATSTTDEALETCTGVLADVAALNSHRVIEFQAPTAQNNYTWYRKYASGWVEQGGISTKQTVSSGATGSQTLTFAIEMADTNYTITFGSVDCDACFQSALLERTTTGGTLKQMNRAGSGSHQIQFSYMVSGMAAQ